MSAFAGRLAKCSVAGTSFVVPVPRRSDRLQGWSESPAVGCGSLSAPLATLTPLPSVVERPVLSYAVAYTVPSRPALFGTVVVSKHVV